MLIQPTIEKLCAMRLRGMAEAFEQQQQDAHIHSLSFEERLGLLIDRQWNWRQNRALERRLRNGRLQGPASIEDIDYRTPRGRDRQLATLQAILQPASGGGRTPRPRAPCLFLPERQIDSAVQPGQPDDRAGCRA